MFTKFKVNKSHNETNYNILTVMFSSSTYFEMYFSILLSLFNCSCRTKGQLYFGNVVDVLQVREVKYFQQILLLCFK
jgi:hypothetical protein